MKKTYPLIILAAVLFCSCKHHNAKLEQTIAAADSVAINYFPGNGKTDTVVAVKIIRDKKSIGQLTDFVTADPVAARAGNGCDGSIHFFKQDMVVQDIYFRMNDDSCRLFWFKQDGNLSATALSPEAKLFLKNL